MLAQTDEKDHPRVCGEQLFFRFTSLFFRGSPPRVRGTARARSCDIRLPVDHPRVCGEQYHYTYIILRSQRITPACAGNSDTARRVSIDTRDHPRVCGEQIIRCPENPMHLGSPPRVRGTVINLKVNAKKSGITPACAGNSGYSVIEWMKEKDHPRVCGEQTILPASNTSEHGSPPRVRGTGPYRSADDIARRITPACAGNSAMAKQKPQISPDHPRVCGEQTGLAEPRLVQYRITPACAGNRATGRTRRSYIQDHPRVCGEQLNGSRPR